MPETTNLVEKASNYILARLKAVVQEHDQLRTNIVETFNPDISGETFANNLRAKIRKNQESINKFLDHVGDNPKIIDKLSPTIQKNPVFNEAFGTNEGSLDMLGDDEEVACKIAFGSTPQGYEEYTKLPEIGPNGFWGNSSATYYSNLLVTMARKPADRNNLFLNSSIFHITPMEANVYAAFADYDFLYKNDDQHGFGFVHNGYVYDGDRHDAALYPNPKKFAPKDCSQFVREMLDFGSQYPTNNDQFRTMDMLYCYRNQQGTGYIKDRKTWLATPKAQELINGLEPIKPEDVQPGDIHVKWQFRNNKHVPTSKRVNAYGHTTIVKSVDNGEVLTIGDGQGAPDRDGFGLEKYPMTGWTSEDQNSVFETGFFRPKPR
jgi:hypothetical protein